MKKVCFIFHRHNCIGLGVGWLTNNDWGSPGRAVRGHRIEELQRELQDLC